MSNSPWYRFFLSVLLLLAMVWLWCGRFDELCYHTFASDELINIGDARSFAEQKDRIPPNSYVAVSGVLGNKAATINGLRAASFRYGRYQIRQILGSKLYVEYDQDKYHPTFNPFTHIEVKGRLVGFGPDSELSKVRTFFKDYYHQPIDDGAMLIVVDEKPRSQFIYPLLFVVSLLLLMMSFYFSLRGFRRQPNSH